MADNNSLKEELVDDGKAVASIAATIAAFANKKSRAIIADLTDVATALGGRATRVAAQLLDRSIVSVALRPLLILSMVFIALGLVAGFVILCQLVPIADFALSLAGFSMIVLATLGLGFPVVILVRTWNVKHYTDFAGLRLTKDLEHNVLSGLLAPLQGLQQNIKTALEESIKRVNALRKQGAAAPKGTDAVIVAETKAQTVLSEMDAMMRLLRREARDGTIVNARKLANEFFAAAEKAIEENDKASVEAQKAQEPNQPLVDQLTMLRDGFLDLQSEAEKLQAAIKPMEDKVGNDLSAKVNKDYGPSGYAVWGALALIIPWVTATILNFWVAIDLRTWHAEQMSYEALSGIFIGLGVITGGILLGVLFAMMVFVKDVLKSGAALIGLGGDLIVRPAADFYIPGVDKKNIDKVIPTGLVGKLDAWMKPFDLMNERVLQVLALAAALLVSEHSLYAFLVVSGLAIVLLGSWGGAGLGDVNLGPVRKAIVVILIVLAIYMFLRRIGGASALDDLAWAMDQWDLFRSADILPILVVGGISLGIGLTVNKYAPHQMVKNTGLYAGGIIALVCLVLTAGLFLEYNPRSDALPRVHHELPGSGTSVHSDPPSEEEVHADAPSEDEPRPDRSPGSDTLHSG